MRNPKTQCSNCNGTGWITPDADFPDEHVKCRCKKWTTRAERRFKMALKLLDILWTPASWSKS